MTLVAQISNEPSPQRNNSPNISNSTELSALHTREMHTLYSVTSLEPDIFPRDDISKDQTFLYGLRAQQHFVPPSLNDLNLPPNSFNLLASMAAVQQNLTQHVDNYSRQSPEPPEPSPISTPLLNLSLIDGWQTLHTTTYDNTLCSEDEPRRIHWNSPLDETFQSEGEPRRINLLPSPSQPRKIKRKSEIKMCFPKIGGVLQHTCKACGHDSADKGYSRPVYTQTI